MAKAAKAKTAAVAAAAATTAAISKKTSTKMTVDATSNIVNTVGKKKNTSENSALSVKKQKTGAPTVAAIHAKKTTPRMAALTSIKTDNYDNTSDDDNINDDFSDDDDDDENDEENDDDSDSDESDDDDDDAAGEGKEFEASKDIISLNPTAQKKLDKMLKDMSKENVGEQRGVMYIGHLPHGFYEDQMRGFFSQFGTVTRVRVSRARKSGNSRGYGWVEFSVADVAEIAAQTMNGYMMFGRVLVANVVNPSDVHVETFKGCEKKFRRIPWRFHAKKKHNAERTVDQNAKRTERLLNKQEEKRKKLAEMGIKYNWSNSKEQPMVGDPLAVDKKIRGLLPITKDWEDDERPAPSKPVTTTEGTKKTTETREVPVNKRKATESEDMIAAPLKKVKVPNQNNETLITPTKKKLVEENDESSSVTPVTKKKKTDAASKKQVAKQEKVITTPAAKKKTDSKVEKKASKVDGENVTPNSKKKPIEKSASTPASKKKSSEKDVAFTTTPISKKKSLLKDNSSMTPASKTLLGKVESISTPSSKKRADKKEEVTTTPASKKRKGDSKGTPVMEATKKSRKTGK